MVGPLTRGGGGAGRGVAPSIWDRAEVRHLEFAAPAEKENARRQIAMHRLVIAMGVIEHFAKLCDPRAEIVHFETPLRLPYLRLLQRFAIDEFRNDRRRPLLAC